MKTYQELKSMGIDFNSLENERQKAIQYRKKKSLPALIIGLASIVAGIIFLFISPGIGFAILAIGLMVALIYYLVINSNALEQVKSKIMNNFFGKLNMDLVYGDISKGKELRKNAFKTGLIKGGSASFDDYISGTINGQPFVMGDLTISDDDDDGPKRTIFQGPIGFIQTSNNYPYTTIFPDTLEKAFGKFGKWMQELNKKNVYFQEDPNFEKYFVVKSSNENFARSIVTAPLREYLREMAAINHVSIVLRENLIMGAIDIRRDLFSLSLKKPIDDAELRSMYEDFVKSYQFMENIYSLITTSGTSVNNVNQVSDEVPPKPSDEVPPPPPSV